MTVIEGIINLSLKTPIAVSLETVFYTIIEINKISCFLNPIGVIFVSNRREKTIEP